MAIRAGQGHWGDVGRENTEQGDTAVLQPSQWPGQTAEGSAQNGQFSASPCPYEAADACWCCGYLQHSGRAAAPKMPIFSIQD